MTDDMREETVARRIRGVVDDWLDGHHLPKRDEDMAVLKDSIDDAVAELTREGFMPFVRPGENLMCVGYEGAVRKVGDDLYRLSLTPITRPRLSLCH